MSTTGSKHQQRCIFTAKRYKFACFHLAKTGPDVIDVALATWCNIAIPSMLSGCEVIPFLEATIEAIERIQYQLTKHILEVPPSSPNVCAQTELGIKPFRMVLYEHQLGFYTRVMNLPQGRWVRRVLSEHLTGVWKSPYLGYISRIRQKLGLWDVPPTVGYLKCHLSSWFINSVNTKISTLNLPFINQIDAFVRSDYVREHDGCSGIASFRLSSAVLGNRAPRAGRQREHQCSLCGLSLDEVHVALVCPAMEEYRQGHTDLGVFRDRCGSRGIHPRLAFKRYVGGLDWRGMEVSVTQHLERGVQLINIRTAWLARS